MLRTTVLSLCFLVCIGGVLFAAPKYANPPLGTKKCVISFDTGQPTTTKDGKHWKIEAKGTYNYDDTWTFKELKIYLTYTTGGMSEEGPSHIYTNESTIGTPGTFNETFNQVIQPKAGQVLVISARITVSKTGEFDQTDVHAKDVPAPPP